MWKMNLKITFQIHNVDGKTIISNFKLKNFKIREPNYDSQTGSWEDDFLRKSNE